MSRYQPSLSQQSAIDALTLAGYTVLRTRSYGALRERVRIAEVRAEIEREKAESKERWALICCAEERRLTHRLNEVCFVATSLGVPITAINQALDQMARE